MTKVAVITGSASGLGRHLVRALAPHYDKIEEWDLTNGIDLRAEGLIADEAANLHFKYGRIDTLINCAGVNYINWLEQVPAHEWDRLMDVNARALFFTAKYLAKHMLGGTILNIVSNAAHMPMTHSVAYNASKAAALMVTKQMARELGKTHKITVFSVSPNKMSGTRMSKEIDERVCELRGWTPQQAAEYQLAALPAGEETPPEVVAEFIAFLLSNKERHKYLAGCDITYGGP